MSACSVADAAVAVVDLVESALSSLSDARLLAAVDAVGKLRRALDVVTVDLAGEMGRRSHAGVTLAVSQGERDESTLLAARAGLDLSEAAAVCTVSRAVGERRTFLGEVLPPRREHLGAAFASGALALSSARRLAQTLDEIEQTAPARVAELERTLTDYAPMLSARELRMLCRRAVDQCDPDGAEPREDRLRALSGIRIAHDEHGLTRWTVTMHPEAAAVLQTAIDARTAPRRRPAFDQDADGPAPDDASSMEDTRTLAQRRLEALVDLARASISTDSGRVAESPITVVVTVPLETLRAGIGTASISGVDEPICAATARRLAADATIIPAVLGGESEVIDLGPAPRASPPPPSEEPWSSATAGASGRDVSRHRAGVKSPTSARGGTTGRPT